MEKRRLGKTDLEVSRLGFGGARIGYEDVSTAQVDEALNTLLDIGVTLIDTAACYEDSEELIGRFIGGRREEYVLASKCGHVVGGASGEDWSSKVISDSINRSLRRLKTDHLDLLQLHSCSVEVLQKGDAVNEIIEAKAAGKTRYVGYSGDGEDALEAIRMGVFDTLQTSFNIVEQKALEEILPKAKEAGMGLIAKRPVANGAVGRTESPYGYADVYWERVQQVQIPEGAPEDGMELSLRFVLSHDRIDTAIVGTVNPEHARRNLEFAAEGLLPQEILRSLHDQFKRVGSEWEQQT